MATMADYSGSTILPSEDEIKRYKPLSLALYGVMEKIGVTAEIAKVKTEMATLSEILLSIVPRPSCSVYYFGSLYEGSSTFGLDSDKDVAYISNDIHVITEESSRSERSCHLLVPDKQPGYARLQLLHHPNSYIMPRGCYMYRLDKNNRRCLTQTHDEKYLQSFDVYVSANGPAWREYVEGKYETISCDTVSPLMCKSWPKCASEWLERKRSYGWPSPDLVKKCESLGFLVVPAFHPDSDEKEFQWRIAFSHQERLLVTQFNPVQQKCYVLLKQIKSGVIEKQLGGETLTSYHCKTCVFYMIENTPNDLWAEENLASCLAMCLRQLRAWVENDNCPNYFIPCENMFDRIRSQDMKQKLGKILVGSLQSGIEPVLLKIKTDHLGLRLFRTLYISGSEKALGSEEINSRLFAMLFCLANLMLTRNYALNSWRGDWKQLVGLQMLNDGNGEKHLDKFLRGLLIKLEGTKRVTNHTERETEYAMSLLLPLLRFCVLSCDVAIKFQQNDQSIKEFIRCKEWDQGTPIHTSYKLKQATAMLMSQDHSNSVAVLSSITYVEKVPFCSCDDGRSGRVDDSLLIQAFKDRPHITVTELLNDYLQPCVIFLPLEKEITPMALRHEMIKSFSQSFVITNDEWADTGEWGVVDGTFLTYFLLYLNHTALGQTESASKNIRQMTELLDGRCTFIAPHV